MMFMMSMVTMMNDYNEDAGDVDFDSDDCDGHDDDNDDDDGNGDDHDNSVELSP
jgi:hypothetical protein